MGTPASWSARQPAHTVAMDDDPLLSVMVLSEPNDERELLVARDDLGESAGAQQGSRVQSAAVRRPIRPVSPTLEGGKK